MKDKSQLGEWETRGHGENHRVSASPRLRVFFISHPSSLVMEHRTGVEPVSQRWQRRVLNQLDQRCENDVVKSQYPDASG